MIHKLSYVMRTKIKAQENFIDHLTSYLLQRDFPLKPDYSIFKLLFNLETFIDPHINSLFIQILYILLYYISILLF
jgi:hypothetical protein